MKLFISHKGRKEDKGYNEATQLTEHANKNAIGFKHHNLILRIPRS